MKSHNNNLYLIYFLSWVSINIPIGILTYEIKINVSDIIWIQPNSGVQAVPQYHLCGKPAVSTRDFINSIIPIPIFSAIT